MSAPFDDRPPAPGAPGDLADGDTPPHGVPPVVVPRTLGRTAEADRPPPREAEHRARHRRAGRDGIRHYRRRRLTRRARKLLVALVVVVLAIVGLVGWFESEADPSGRPGKPVVIDVHRGESLSALMGTLTHDGVIGSSLAYRLWSFVHGQPSVRSGLYQLRRNLPFGTVSADLAAGPNVYALDVVPGTTLSEISNQLSQLPGDLAQSFEQAARTGEVRSPYQPTAGATVEGLIGEGTYRITPGETSRHLLSAMEARFDAEAKTAGLLPTSVVNGASAYDVVTVASIAMKEGYFPRYFGKVARVVYNRLADGMRLDMTSTVLYSLGQDGGTVTPAEEQETTPYNTYLHDGLTPTPICTPSEAALRAAADPPAGPWLYFELTTAKKGVMVFSANYTTQLAAERQASANAASNGGSSGTGTGT